MAPAVKVASRHSQTTKTKGSVILVIPPGYKATAFPRKRKYSFLSLPGELRNQIYPHVFAPGVYIELLAPSANYTIPLDKTPFARRADLPTIRVGRPLGASPRAQSAATKWPTSYGAIALANRQLHRETTTYFYEAATFYVQSPNRLINLLSVLPPNKLQHIRKLHIAWQTYADPEFHGDARWKEKCDRKWSKAFTMIADKLDLQELRLALDVRTRPFTLALREAWLAPVLVLMKGRNGRGASCTMQNVSDIRVSLDSEYTSQLYEQVYANALVGSGRSVLAAEQMARQRVQQYKAVHQLFSNAIRRRLMGWDEASSVERYEAEVNEGGWYAELDASFIVRRR